MTPTADGTCGAVPVEPAVDPRALARAIVTILVVEGMGCSGCVARVRGALLQPAGVLAVEVELKRGLATVYSRGPVDSRQLGEAVGRAGEASGQRYRVRRFATVHPMTEGAVTPRRAHDDHP